MTISGQDLEHEERVAGLLHQPIRGQRIPPFSAVEVRLRHRTPAVVGALVAAALVVVALVAGNAIAARRAAMAGPSAGPAVATASALASAQPTPLATVGGTSAPAVTANADAFRGMGKLAYSTRAGLFVLDGANGTSAQLGTAGQARWSRDGIWLAYAQAITGGTELWLTHADGSARTRVSGLPPSANVIFEWSPKDNVLAVMPQGPGATGLWLVRPGLAVPFPLVQAATVLAARDTSVWSFAWSPDGGAIAYSLTLPAPDPTRRSDAVLTVDVRSGAALERFTVGQAGALGISWWPDGQGLLYYLDPQHSGSMLMDGVPLVSVALSGSRKGGTFAERKIDTFGEWIDEHRFVAVVGSGRWPTADKHLAVCDIDGVSCQRIGPSIPDRTGAPGPSVELEPALSLDRTRIAFVRAADRGPSSVGFSSEAEARDWMATRTLWVLDIPPNETSWTQVRRLPGSGMFAPAWSGDGKYILVTHDGAVWIYDAASTSANASRLLSPLDPATPFGGPGWSFDWWR